MTEKDVVDHFYLAKLIMIQAANGSEFQSQFKIHLQSSI